jgi:peptidoglycan/xylan/chitin deacetylase (PgdA/CDA1 family)
MLLYHALFAAEGNPEKYAIPASEFERHVKYLAENGFQTLSLADLSQPGNLEKNRRYVIISFDDGCSSDYTHALPILRKYGFVGTFFATVNRIGTDAYIDWKQLREMADHGMSIQSHSLNHVFLSDLGDEQLAQELGESKRILEERLSRPIEYISLPGGFISDRVLRAAKDAGYSGVVTSCPGLNTGRDVKYGVPFFKRFVITRLTSPLEFQNIVHGDTLYAGKQALLYHAKNSAKKMLGSRLYYSLWSKFFKYKK